MSDYTNNLNLLKKNPQTDGNDYFNIQTMLNDNWDKVDAAVAAKETPAGAQAKVDNLAGAGRTTQTVKGNAEAIAALNQTVASHSAEDATTAIKGHVQLATNAEVTAGTNTAKAMTPAGAKVELDKKIEKSLATAADQVMVSTGVGAWAVKTLAQFKAWLGLGDAAYKNTGTVAGTVAAGNHAHSAADITSGTLPITRGGTGATTAAAALTALGVTATAAELNILDGVTGITAAELSYVGDVTSMIQAQLNGKAASSHSQAASTITAGTLPVGVVATNSTDYGTSRLRNVYAGTADMVSGTTALASGSIYVMYE